MRMTTEHDLEVGKTVHAMRDRQHYPFVPEHVRITSENGEITTVEVRGPQMFSKVKEYRVRVYTGRDLWLKPDWLNVLVHEHLSTVKEDA
jgi:hypothetical protein